MKLSAACNTYVSDSFQHTGKHCGPRSDCSLRSSLIWVHTVFNRTVLNGLVGGVQWLSGRVIDSRPKGRGFEPHQHHCFVSLSKTHLSLLSTGSTQEDCPCLTERLLMGHKEATQRKKEKKESDAYASD